MGQKVGVGEEKAFSSSGWGLGNFKVLEDSKCINKLQEESQNFPIPV